MVNYGIEEGTKCGRENCNGIIKVHPVENCSCHISPPCHECTTPRNYCPICGWEESEDIPINDYNVTIDPITKIAKTWTLRKLDKTKIDWTSHSHTNFSMTKSGVYPEGSTMEDVIKKVNGTFGGRFNYFCNGKFEFVAYTD